MIRKLTTTLAAAALAFTITACAPETGTAAADYDAGIVQQVAIAPAALETSAPQACLDALDEADELQQINADQSQAVATFFRAMETWSKAGMPRYGYGLTVFSGALQDLLDDTKSNTAKVLASNYGEYAAACRAGS